MSVSVCPSHAGIESKRLNVRSRKQRNTLDVGLQLCHCMQRDMVEWA